MAKRPATTLAKIITKTTGTTRAGATTRKINTRTTAGMREEDQNDNEETWEACTVPAVHGI